MPRMQGTFDTLIKLGGCNEVVSNRHERKYDPTLRD